MLTGLGLERFGIVGRSSGGFWALSMAFAQAERIRGLVIVNGAGGPITDEELAKWKTRAAARRQAEPSANTEAEPYDGLNMPTLVVWARRHDDSGGTRPPSRRRHSGRSLRGSAQHRPYVPGRSSARVRRGRGALC